MKDKIFLIIACLIVFEIFFVSFMIYQERGMQGFCLLESDCEIVQSSKYSQLFGIDLTYLALSAFTLLLIFLYFDEKIFLVATFFGAVFALYFIFLQFFILNQICSQCMIIDSVMILICGLSIYRSRKHN